MSCIWCSNCAVSIYCLLYSFKYLLLVSSFICCSRFSSSLLHSSSRCFCSCIILYGNMFIMSLGGSELPIPNGFASTVSATADDTTLVSRRIRLLQFDISMSGEKLNELIHSTWSSTTAGNSILLFLVGTGLIFPVFVLQLGHLHLHFFSIVRAPSDLICLHTADRVHLHFFSIVRAPSDYFAFNLPSATTKCGGFNFSLWLI